MAHVAVIASIWVVRRLDGQSHSRLGVNPSCVEWG